MTRTSTIIRDSLLAALKAGGLTIVRAGYTGPSELDIAVARDVGANAAMALQPVDEFECRPATPEECGPYDHGIVCEWSPAQHTKETR
jgi:hypothetical protein